jgi:NAD(P)-dependent dehydrogenase (short-subunit alcohol dehydrogenase family)
VKRTTVILGGARGIGRACAELLAAGDNYVLVVDKDTDVEPIHGVTMYQHDARNINTIDYVRSYLQDIHSVIVTIGQQGVHGPEGMPMQHLVGLFTANSFASMIAAWHLGSRMKSDAMAYENPYDRSIVLVSSIAGLTAGGPGLAAYGAAKGALISFVKSMAPELAPEVRINALCPGWTDTAFNRPTEDLAGGRRRLLERVRDTVPLGRMADPREVAEAAVWLGSPAASYVTGSTMVVDGGLTA